MIKGNKHIVDNEQIISHLFEDIAPTNLNAKRVAQVKYHKQPLGMFIFQQQEFLTNIDSAIYSNSSYMANVAIYGYVDGDFSSLLSSATTPLNDEGFSSANGGIACDTDNVNYDQPRE